MTEEKRLAAVVAAIADGVVAVPRGAYYKDAIGKIRPNPLFPGKPMGHVGWWSGSNGFNRGHAYALYIYFCQGCNEANSTNWPPIYTSAQYSLSNCWTTRSKSTSPSTSLSRLKRMLKRVIVRRVNFLILVHFWLGSVLTRRVHLGSWSLQLENANQFAVLRSLAWPGYVAYHVPNSSQFGSFYLGTGQKNHDLGYML
jgi:hypothetical protein